MPIKQILLTVITSFFLLNACNGKLPGGDARKFPADPKKRVENNLKEGRGFRLSGGDGGLFSGTGSRNFDFASANELWRASLDIIDFMPLTSVNYSGGIIITDWYSDDKNSNESIKISIRFLTNEIRSDALDIKIFNRVCSIDFNCKTVEIKSNLVTELKKEILKTAATYKEENQDKIKQNNKNYKYPNIKY